MSFILKLLGGSIGPYIAGAVGALIAGLALALALTVAQLHGAQADTAKYKGLFDTEQRAFRTEKAVADAERGARTDDHAAAISDANDTQAACDARVARARTSGSAIRTILSEPPHATVDPAEPELLDAGQLRHAQGR